jgi:hypothetical protein
MPLFGGAAYHRADAACAVPQGKQLRQKRCPCKQRHGQRPRWRQEQQHPLRTTVPVLVTVTPTTERGATTVVMRMEELLLLLLAVQIMP